jgi:hypothetical protein
VNTNRYRLISISTCAGCIFFFVLFILFCGTPWAAEATPDCEIHESSCTKTIGAYTVELDILPNRLQQCRILPFGCWWPVMLLQAPYIDLGMPGMHMGPNRVDLKPSAAMS